MASLSAAETVLLLENWPSDDSGLPPTVEAAYRGWKALTLAAIDPAIARLDADPAVGFSTPAPGGFLKTLKCRTLTAHVLAPPLGSAPSLIELRSMLPGSLSAGADPEVARQLMTLAEELKSAQDTIASLVRQQASDDKDDVTADYEVHEDVVKALPTSFVALLPLPRKERQQISRDCAGQYPEKAWPASLAMSESTKSCKEMQKAKKLTLPEYSKEVSKFMDRNSTVTKLVGTAWSRVVDIEADLQEQVTIDPDIVFRGSDLLGKVSVINKCLEGTFTMSLDAATHLRLNVADRVDVAMGIDHLRIDPRKKETDDFLSDDTYKLVESAAKKKQDLTWAKTGVFPGSQVGRFSGQPPPRSTGGGGKYSSGRGKGGGGRGKGGKGSGGGSGRGRGKGGGGNKSSKESSGGD